ncbi:MAG TPA: S53 family peptidase [Myxococcales bacterium]|nr:S53 family peptidase [Myxococcales bacterium]
MIKTSATVALALAVALVGLSASATKSTKPVTHNKVHTSSAHDPNVMSIETAGADFGLFSCQVGRSTGQCFDPFQMRTAYGADKLIAQGFDGKGKTIVIVDAFQNPNLLNQVAFFNNFYGLPQFNTGSGPTLTVVAPDGLTPFDAHDSNMVGWAEEISLDVEWAHAIAPGANIVLESGADNSDVALIDAINDAIDNHRGDVISMSFGEADVCLGPDLTAAWHKAFANATAKGITLFASAGDQGASQPSCDGNTWIKSTSSPASDPLVTSVGGTELHAADYCLPSLGCNPATHPAAGTYQGEIGWNEGPQFGDFQNFFGNTEAGGGGFSAVWDAPSYQQGTLHGAKARGVADVSYNAAILHGVLTYLDFPGVPTGFFRFGGTSAGAPQWAALTAIAAQAAGHGYGFINSALYKIGQSNAASAFNDVTSAVNSAVEFDSAGNPVTVTGFSAVAGWDAFTGVGSPKASGVVNGLSAIWAPGQGVAATAQSGHSTGKPGHGEAQPH